MQSMIDESALARLLMDYDGDWTDVPLPEGTEDWDWDYHYSQGLEAIASR